MLLQIFIADSPNNKVQFDEWKTIKMIKCITAVISAIKVAILLIRLIGAVVVVVAHFVPDNANPVRFTLEFAVLATFWDMISTVQWVIQWFEMWFCCGFCYEDVWWWFYVQILCSILKWMIKVWNEKRKIMKMKSWVITFKH